MLRRTTNFNEVVEKVSSIKETEKSYYVDHILKAKRRNLLDVSSYSSYGLSSAGSRLGFPGKWVESFGELHPDTAKRILNDAYTDYFIKLDMKSANDKRQSTKLFIRDFNDKHCGVLTDKYAVFDDDEVTNILSKNNYLMNAEEYWYDVSAERFHVRFISKQKLYIEGDDSPLSMCVFVDNSMIGQSSFKIRFGIYRWACTNGMIAGLKEFEIVREAHKGTKSYVKIVAEALKEVPLYEQMMLDMIKEASVTKSKIYGLDEEQALAYIQKTLNVSKKASVVILENYRNYGGSTKWDLTNAITDYAHVADINTRVQLESKALKIA